MAQCQCMKNWEKFISQNTDWAQAKGKETAETTHGKEEGLYQNSSEK